MQETENTLIINTGETDMCLLNNNSPNPKYRRVNSVLEYIINHRQDIIDKVENERKQNKKFIVIDEVENIEKKELEKKINYYSQLKWYIVFIIFGCIGGLFINIISGVPILRFDMIFNLIISPIIYYQSPRNILTNIPKSDFYKYYCIPFIIGLFFRFLEYFPGLSQFVLDPHYIHTNLQIALLSCTIVLLMLLSIYYIYISSNPILNIIFLILELSIIITASYVFLINGGTIHVHHYFIGLILMLVSKNYHSKIVIITHAISYAIYIEGISKYGFDSIYWI
jgi:hypothetical protein